MNFNIVTGNHDGQQIDDYVMLLRLTIEAAGHNASVLLGSVPTECNVIIENFPNGFSACGEYVLVATEMITGDTFNNFAFQHHHYSHKAYWEIRYRRFIEAADGAKAIWLCTSDTKQLGLYREKTGKPVVELKTPFFQKFVRAKREQARVDFFFTGTKTDYRIAMLRAILTANQHAKIWFSDITTQFNRSQNLIRSRYALDIRLCEEYAQISALRVWYQLMCGVPTICQTPAMDAYLLPYALHSTDLPTMCNNVLAAGVTGEDLVQKFRDETDAVAESKRVLEETFG